MSPTDYLDSLCRLLRRMFQKRQATQGPSETYVVVGRLHGEFWIAVYDEAHREQAMERILQWSMHPDLSLLFSEAVSLCDSLDRWHAHKGKR